MMLSSTRVGQAFNRCANTYADAARVPNEIGLRLLERLDYLTLVPETILDLGCGSGFFSLQLKKRYPKARVIAVDVAEYALRVAKSKQTWRHRWPLIGADMHALPFVDGAFDLVFANQVLHWTTTQAQVFAELHRVMRPDGCLMFSLLGLDSYRELRDFEPLETHLERPHFQTHAVFDMHPVGDALMAAQWLDPVMDRQILVAEYTDFASLVHNLRAQGMRNLNPERSLGLMGKARWEAFKCHAETTRTRDGKLPLTYEVIYGHAWKGALHQYARETFIPVSALRTRR